MYTRVYEYRCPSCGDFDRPERAESVECACGKTAKRVYSGKTLWNFTRTPAKLDKGKR